MPSPLWVAASHPLISHNLTVSEVTAESYWALMALPLSLAGVPYFSGSLKSSHTLTHSASAQEERVCRCWSLMKKLPGFPKPPGTPGPFVSQRKCLTFDLLPLFSLHPLLLAGTSRKAGTLGRSFKKVFALLEIRVAEDNKKRWRQNKGKSNARAPRQHRCSLEYRCISKGATKVFSLQPDRRSSRVN